MRPLAAICQPHYLPWIGYFEMIDRVDVFVFLDDVQFIQREWKNRNRIRGERRGQEPKWLSVPVQRECKRGTPIHETLLSEGSWRQEHLDSFRHVYRGAPFLSDALDLLRSGLDRPHRFLGPFNEAIVREICIYLGIHRRFERSSELGCPGRKTERLVNLCQAVEARAYLANNGSAGYLDGSLFEAQGLAWEFQDYSHPSYEQWDGGESLPFLSHLSILDLIANHGPASLDILRLGRGSHA